MDDSNTTTINIDLNPEEEYQMIITGFATRLADGSLEITHVGSKWLKKWCERKIKELEGR